MDAIIQKYIYQQQWVWTQKKETKINMGQNNLKGITIMDIWTYGHIELVTTPTLCRDCKHTITHLSQCYLTHTCHAASNFMKLH